VAFSPDGRYLAFATCATDYTYIAFILVWDRRQQKAVRLLKLDSDSVDALAFRADNRVLAVVMGHGGSISLYSLDAGPRLREHLEGLSPRTFSSQRDLLYGMSWSEPVAVHSPHVGMIQRLDFSADGKILKAVCYGGAAVRLYARSGRVLSRSGPPDGYKVQATAVSDRGTAAGRVEDSQALVLWEVPRWGDS
jgi:WD40 repeat protein